MSSNLLNKISRKSNLYIVAFILFCLSTTVVAQQVRKLQNLPYVDQKIYHYGFMVGFHTQDMVIYNSGYVSPSNGESWFAEIPNYNVGLSVGIIGDRYLSQSLNLRVVPSLHFGERKFVFRERSSADLYDFTFKSSTLTLPLNLKFSGARSNNIRPYLVAGGYTSVNISKEKNLPLRFDRLDYGLEFGVGCNLYMPLFKLCPELKFSFGLADLMNKDNSDLIDKDLQKYRDAVSGGKSRMVSLVFNFE